MNRYVDGIEGTRIIVCGGRHYDDADMVDRVLSEHVPDVIRKKDHEIWPVIVHGAAAGADMLADDWALGHDVAIEAHPANWDVHGRAAGPIRNQEMADAGADLCIAFPGGKGTADMVRRATRAGIQVVKVDA